MRRTVWGSGVQTFGANWRHFSSFFPSPESIRSKVAVSTRNAEITKKYDVSGEEEEDGREGEGREGYTKGVPLAFL